MTLKWWKSAVSTQATIDDKYSFKCFENMQMVSAPSNVRLLKLLFLILLIIFLCP